MGNATTSYFHYEIYRLTAGLICIDFDKVYDNTWWSSSAESAIVLADSRNIDNLDIAKMFLVRNEVYGNRNYIPYYNEKYDDPQYLIDNQMHVARPGYGSKNQTFIIDGSGIYVENKILFFVCLFYENSQIQLLFRRNRNSSRNS